MCGGALIADYDEVRPVRRERKLTSEDLWSEFGSISDLLGLDYNGKSHPKQPLKGNIFIVGVPPSLLKVSFFFWCRKQFEKRFWVSLNLNRFRVILWLGPCTC